MNSAISGLCFAYTSKFCFDGGEGAYVLRVSYFFISYLLWKCPTDKFCSGLGTYGLVITVLGNGETGAVLFS